MTKQPVWELVANLGDVNVAEYGGFLVYRDKTGVYPPEAELYEANENATGGRMYRFILEPPRFKTFKGGHFREELLKNPAERNRSWYWYKEWFIKDLPGIASSCGTTAFRLLRLLFSKKPVERASAYQMIVGYFGPHEFDSYSVVLTEREAKKRYATVEDRLRKV